MLDTHITLTVRNSSQFSPPPFWIAYGSRIGDWAHNCDWSLQFNIRDQEENEYEI